MAQLNPYSDTRFVGYVTSVAPNVTKVHFPSSILLKKFYRADEPYHAITGKYIIIEGSGTGFLGKILEIALPEKERLELTESKYEREAFHPTGRVEILLCFDNYGLNAKKGLDQLPPVGAKVYLCSNEFLSWLLIDFGKKENEATLPLAHLPQDEAHKINVSAQALFGRHCAVVGTTGGGKSWTVSKLIQEVVASNGKAILIDPTGEYKTLISNSKVEYLAFNSLENDGVYLDYKSLRETDLYALFRPTGQAQIPKLQEAMRSLRLVKVLKEKEHRTVNDQFILNPQNGYWKENELHNITTITKTEKPRKNITTAFKENNSVFGQNCDFDINALPYQVFSECVRDFSANDNYGQPDTNAQGFCQSMISRVLVTTSNKSFQRVFGFIDYEKPNNELSDRLNEFLKPESTTNVLILSVEEVPTENKLKEILVNAVGRMLLEMALDKKFKNIQESDKKKSLLLFLDEAHLFLDKKIKDEYSIEVELDAFDRIAKECRKHGLFLVIATQMPRDIPKGVLSQMGTFIVHRLINQSDREAIEYACSEANKSALSFLPILSRERPCLLESIFQCR